MPPITQDMTTPMMKPVATDMPVGRAP